MRTLAGGDPQAAAAAHPMFRHYNRGKRAMTLDLTTEAGRNVLYKLVEDADVFLTSYLPATRKKLGFDIDDIRARNPRIIYARGPARGQRARTRSAAALTAPRSGAGGDWRMPPPIRPR